MNFLVLDQKGELITKFRFRPMEIIFIKIIAKLVKKIFIANSKDPYIMKQGKYALN